MKKCALAAVGCAALSTNALAQSLADVFLDPHKAQICASLEPLPTESCQALLSEAVTSKLSGASDMEALTARVEEELLDPVFLNSAVAKVFGGGVPLGIEFKMLDAEEGESVLGLTYTVDYEFAGDALQPKENWSRDYFVVFQADGTLTQDNERNPRDLQDIRFQLGASKWTRFPPQDMGFQTALGEANVARAQACATDEVLESQECQEATAKMFGMLDETMDFIRAFHYYDFGVELGYETSQGSSASAKKFGGFLFGQYESWGDGSFLGALGITPAFRIALESMDPDNESPRATLAGDDSGYYRFSGELSFWMPLPATSEPLALTFSYRHYRELDASESVKLAGLESNNLRTFTLSASNGVVVSYSSGSLPFSEQDEDVLTLGWQTHF